MAREANGVIHALALVGNTLYAGGKFTKINGVSANRIAKFDDIRGIAESATWEISIDNRHSIFGNPPASLITPVGPG